MSAARDRPARKGPHARQPRRHNEPIDPSTWYGDQTFDQGMPWRDVAIQPQPSDVSVEAKEAHIRAVTAPGKPFPDHRSPDYENVLRKLSDLWRDDPPILTLTRDYYSLREHQQHLQLTALYPDVAVSYTDRPPRVEPAPAFWRDIDSPLLGDRTGPTDAGSKMR